MSILKIGKTMEIDSTLGALTYVSSADVVGGTIQIPREAYIITGSVFKKIKELEHIVIPWNVEIINQEAFCNCENLQEVTIENEDCELSYSVFRGCKKLIKIKLPKRLKKLHTGMFMDCISLQEIVVPNGVPHLELGQFGGCRNLEKIHWREHVYSYEDLLEYGMF